MVKAKHFIGALLLFLFATTTPAQAAIQTVASEGSYTLYYYGGKYGTAAAACNAWFAIVGPEYGSLIIAPANDMNGAYCTARHIRVGFSISGTATYVTTCPPVASGEVRYTLDQGGQTCSRQVACPVHASDSPCVCDAGYVWDTSRTSCIEQYDLTLNSQAGDIEPSGTAAGDSNSSKAMSVRVINSNTKQPKEGAQVRITLNAQERTGGHKHHDAQRPKGALSGCNLVSDGVYNCTTGPDGYAGFTFNATPVSGTHTVKAECISPACTNTPQPAEVNVKVAGLLPIPESPFYRPISPNADTNHPNTHYLKTDASSKLQEIARAYYAATYQLKDGWIPNVLLNDASLEGGGVLDCFLTCKNSVPWGPAHKEHRRGAVIDIRARVPAENNPNPDTLLFEDKFIESALKAGVDPGDPHNTGNFRHYHLKLFGVGE